MRVVYYTTTYFLDVALEIINVLKKQVDLHVFIEITSSSKNINIADIKEFPAGQKLATPAQLLSADSLKHFEPYLHGAASVHFVIHEHKTGLSFSTIKSSLAVLKLVKPLKPDIFHFEGFTLRSTGLLPFLFFVKKVFLVIHDPVPHSGEKSWKISLPNRLFFYLPYKKYFVFYSEFARNLFKENYKAISDKKLLIPMSPYSYYPSLSDNKGISNESSAILFFGRISPYKGVSVLLQAIPTVLQRFPRQIFVIAGKGNSDNLLDSHVLQQYKDNIVVINRYIHNEELSVMISNAKFVVCPYLDATQSGVLMTAFAFNKPVIASKVGAFSEYITDYVNGLLVAPGDAVALAATILQALDNNLYKDLEHNLVANNANNNWDKSLTGVLKAYNEEI
jgi:glycosyltransferase involved in cell wall biosynthesis